MQDRVFVKISDPFPVLAGAKSLHPGEGYLRVCDVTVKICRHLLFFDDGEIREGVNCRKIFVFLRKIGRMLPRVVYQRMQPLVGQLNPFFVGEGGSFLHQLCCFLNIQCHPICSFHASFLPSVRCPTASI